MKVLLSPAISAELRNGLPSFCKPDSFDISVICLNFLQGLAHEGLNIHQPRLEGGINRQDKGALDLLLCTCLQDTDPNQSPCGYFWS